MPLTDKILCRKPDVSQQCTAQVAGCRSRQFSKESAAIYVYIWYRTIRIHIFFLQAIMFLRFENSTSKYIIIFCIPFFAHTIFFSRYPTNRFLAASRLTTVPRHVNGCIGKSTRTNVWHGATYEQCPKLSARLPKIMARAQERSSSQQGGWWTRQWAQNMPTTLRAPGTTARAGLALL
jgi:hypothetical protein